MYLIQSLCLYISLSAVVLLSSSVALADSDLPASDRMSPVAEQEIIDKPAELAESENAQSATFKSATSKPAISKVLDMPANSESDTSFGLSNESDDPERKSLASMMIEMLLGLAAVILLISGMAFLYRRSRLFQAGQYNALKVVTVLSVGPKQKVMLVRLLSSHVLIGVTDHQVNILHHLSPQEESELSQWMGQSKTDKPLTVDSEASTEDAAASFNNLLKKVLSKPS